MVMFKGLKIDQSDDEYHKYNIR